MRYWIDTEFNERGYNYPVDLISVGIVAEDGRELYLINWDADLESCNDWVKENVLSALPFKPFKAPEKGKGAWQSRSNIRNAIAVFMGCKFQGFEKTPAYALESDVTKPEFWGEWSSYDWVVFCQIFGEMVDLPTGLPMRCNDIIQVVETELNIPYSELPASLETEGNHNALIGARSVKQRWEWIEAKKSTKAGGRRQEAGGRRQEAGGRRETSPIKGRGMKRTNMFSCYAKNVFNFRHA